MLCRMDYINFGICCMNEVDIKQLDSSDGNNSLYKELLNDFWIIVYELICFFKIITASATYWDWCDKKCDKNASWWQ